MSTLLTIINESADIVQDIIEAHGEISADLELQLQSNDIDLKHKLDSYAYLWERLEVESTFFKSKSDQMLKVSKSIEKVNRGLKDRLKYAMKQLEKNEVAGSEFKFKLAKTSGRLVILNEASIPKEYKYDVVLEQIDKVKLKEALASGKAVAGAELIKEHSLRKYINRGK